MNTSGKLHNAGERGAKAIHRGTEHLKAAIHNVTATVRKLQASRAAGRPTSSHADPEQDRERPPNSKVRTGIVSVNGRDVGEMCCTGGRRPA
jgi:hypothetical protein